MDTLKVASIEPTPNPMARKFVLAEALPGSGVRQFENAQAGEKDPLAKALFGVPGVETVFYGGDFVTVSLEGGSRWRGTETRLIEEIEKIQKTDVPAAEEKKSAAPSENELLDKINMIIDQSVRPALSGDGGGLEVIDLDGYVLSIHYQGACGSCPSATQGTMMAIENLLKSMVDPRIKVVSA